MRGSNNQNNRALAEAVKKITPSLGHYSISDEAGVEHYACEGGGAIPSIKVRSYRALVKVVGFFKYNYGPVLFRGQASCRRTLIPSGYRNATAPADTDKRIDKFIQHVRDKGLVDYMNDQRMRATTEPLLQHYGLRTRWIDLVDSIPHALFFALNRCVQSPYSKKQMTFVPSDKAYGSLLLVRTGTMKTTRIGGKTLHGVWSSDTGLRICDLRIEKPGTALRPHSQHAFLCTKTKKGTPGVDLWPHVIAHIFFDVSEAKSWIGGDALSREALFPGPKWDQVYGSLLGAPAQRHYAEFKQSVDPTFDVDFVADYDFCHF